MANEIKEYEPFGDYWKKEIKKLPKDFIIDMLSAKGKEVDKLREEIQQLKQK